MQRIVGDGVCLLPPFPRGPPTSTALRQGNRYPGDTGDDELVLSHPHALAAVAGLGQARLRLRRAVTQSLPARDGWRACNRIEGRMRVPNRCGKIRWGVLLGVHRGRGRRVALWFAMTLEGWSRIVLKDFGRCARIWRCATAGRRNMWGGLPSGSCGVHPPLDGEAGMCTDLAFCDCWQMHMWGFRAWLSEREPDPESHQGIEGKLPPWDTV